MKNQHKLVFTAITSLLVMGITTSSAYAEYEEKCWGVAKAGQNACNSNKSKHTCAGHSKADNDPNDFITLPEGSCLKIGGKLEPGEETNPSAKKM